MRIAQICPPWFSVPPTGYGGIEWVVALLADGLAERGHDVTLFASGGSTTKATLVSEFETPPGGAMLGQMWFEAVQAVSAYKHKDSFDVVHDHCGIIGPSIGANIDGPPIVHTLHGPFTEQAKRYYRLTSPPLHLVAISEAQRAFCPDLNYAGTVHNGIDLAQYPMRVDKEDYLFFLGRINREKGPEIAVEIAARAGMKLKMAVKMSEPFEQEYWREVIEPRLTGNEEILGEVSVEEKAALLAGARATLFPIQWPEPFGLVMTESMACGTPVLAFPNGAAPEVIVDGVTGYLPETIDEMVACIERLDRIDPAACRAHVEKNFGAATMVAGYEQIFERLRAR
ncbi:MAG TPA: glycosyltransferase family 4 protein [Actinomycetota bacterium]